MSLTLAASLAAHQRGPARLPALRVRALNTRAGFPILRWQRIYSGAEANVQTAATLTPLGTLLRFRNNGGTVQVNRVTNAKTATTGFGSWVNTGASATSGRGIAADSVAGLTILVYPRGNILYYRTSTDDGATWSAEATAVNHGAPVNWPAFAFREDATAGCAFFEQGNTLYRLRLTSLSPITWAASATAWTRTMATINGIGATHRGGDYALAITGTRTTTLHPEVNAAIFGDQAFPTDTWSTLKLIIDADPASTLAYRRARIARLTGGSILAAWHQLESGPNTFNAHYTSHPPAGSGPTTEWIEPEPFEPTGDDGVSLTNVRDGVIFATTAPGVWRATLAGTADLSPGLVSVRASLRPFSASLHLELDDTSGTLALAAPEALFAGCAIELALGYRSGTAGAPEYGATWTFIADRITHRLDGKGRRLCTIEGTGLWELLGRWQAPQAWQVPAGTLTRSAIFTRILARAAGILAVSATSPEAPTTDWTTPTPSWSLAQGEYADNAARRLFQLTDDLPRADGSAIEVVGTSTTTPANHTFAWQATGTDHPVYDLELSEAPKPVNWARAIGPDRYADSIDYPDLYATGPRRRTVRQLDATTNARADGYARGIRRSWRNAITGGWNHVVNSRQRLQSQHDAAETTIARQTADRGTLRIPVHCGLQLFDLLDVTHPLLQAGTTRYRAVELTLDYAAGPAGNARYDLEIALGDP
jgi:hypothetical protein